MGVGHFDLSSLAKAQLIDPKDVGYKDSIDIIYDELQRTRKSFVKIGWYLKHINEGEMYKEDGYLNIYEFAHDKFNISQSTATRFINLCVEFSIGHDSPELDERYVDFSVSQLFEMLPMKQEEKETVTPDMTVKEIRAIKKDNRISKEPVDVDKKSEDPDDNIPGQTSIEKDFPEYMPEENKVSSGQDSSEVEEVIVDEEPEEVVESYVVEEDAALKTEETSEQYIQPELPILKNNDMRKNWLNNYKNWGLWYRDDNIDVNYYKFDFEDGSRLIVAEYPQRYMYWSNETHDQHFFHLLEKNKKGYKKTYDEKYSNSVDSETYLIDFLKNLQKN